MATANAADPITRIEARSARLNPDRRPQVPTPPLLSRLIGGLFADGVARQGLCEQRCTQFMWIDPLSASLSRSLSLYRCLKVSCSQLLHRGISRPSAGICIGAKLRVPGHPLGPARESCRGQPFASLDADLALLLLYLHPRRAITFANLSFMLHETRNA